MLPHRLLGLQESRGPGGLRVFTARSFRARLLGLARMDEMPDGCALLIPACSSVHTFGMRFAIDIAFLDREGAVLSVKRDVPPRRLVRCRGAAGVVEWRSDPGAPRDATGFPRAERA